MHLGDKVCSKASTAPTKEQLAKTVEYYGKYLEGGPVVKRPATREKEDPFEFELRA
jgi:hypothetical protein